MRKNVPKKTKKKDNVIDLKEVIKKPKHDNITLDKNKETGKYITYLEHYKKDYERMLTIDDVLLLIPKILTRRSWSRWRGINEDLPREKKIGPEYTILGQRIYQIKAIWVFRYIKGLRWEPEPQMPVSATQRDDMQLRSKNSF